MKTAFREKVFEVVRKIPRGECLTYREVARRAGSPRACRAVGNILATHKESGLPCHRVIRSDGTAGGYKGKISLSRVKADMLAKEGMKCIKGFS
ncbi:hypothetical protein A2110_01835 [Candidatus Jorgensenbacteria bacterium GWA1_54_12]|uniref:Methylated-DNA-[protein]-cysteine S-methyltransferase DNA binding domain-containing protein n=1 Tax=Candidatus Jorgensenbacteria bacterium GWA1_54_12 TaxID=1798468 RepID=A0A1F6BLM3_9BACT|nr:MAG: hypothetical protein A2110_01835 [Candidatus Jorgensenbacteria bacterium GWA1_54_12]